MKRLFFTALFFISSGSLAQYTTQSNLGSFNAPVIYSVNNLPVDIPGGAIVFDMSAGVFKGLIPATSANNWVALSAPSGSSVIVSNASTDRVERISFGGSSELSACTGTCTIYRQSGSAGSAATVTRNTTGDYTVTFPSGVFSAIPTCSIYTSYSDTARFVVGISKTYTSGSVAIRFYTRNLSDSNVDTANDIVCVGPR